MARVADYLPSNLLKKSPTFQDFIIAAQRCKPHSTLVLRENGRLEKQAPHELQDEGMNRRTWDAFCHAVYGEFSKTRLKHICSRYRLNLKHLQKSSFPLETRMIEYFGVGAANPYTYNLMENLPSFFSIPFAYKLPYKIQTMMPSFFSLEQRSPKKIHDYFEEASRMRYLGPMKDPADVHGGVEYSHENWVHDDLEMDRRRANLFRGIAEMGSKDPKIPWMHPYFSRLAMGIICQLETKQDSKDIELVIPAPGCKEGELEYYKVFDIISGGGLSAVALVPVSDKSHLVPILAFRCTKQAISQTDAFDSFRNDLEESIGESGYKACKESLQKLMQNRQFTKGKKVTVLSYSLGGGHAGHFLRDFWDKVKEFVGFNFVGNKGEVIDSIAEQINKLPKDAIPPAFYTYRNVSNKKGTKGDWVNKSGEKHVGCGIKHPNAIVQVVEWIIDEADYPAPTEDISDQVQFYRWMNLHGARPMDSDREEKMKGKYDSPWRYKYNLHLGPIQCTKILDTYKRDPTMENLRRRVASEFLYKFIHTIYAVLDFIFRVFGIEFFRKNL